MTSWEYVKEFYRRYFGIEDWVIELYANMDILRLFVSGASNKTIENLCQMDLDDIAEILMNTFQYPGWKTDLPVNPYKLYSDVSGNYKLFYRYMRETNVFELRFIKYVYVMCKTMYELEERIADEWI